MRIQAHADIHYKRLTGETALLRAARTRDERCVRQLLLRGASVLVTEEEGRNALHLAALYGCDAVLNVLLAQARVAELVNACTHGGLTPLMIAAKHGWWRCVRSLVSCKDTQLGVTNLQARTAKDLARLEEHFTCVAEIERCEAEDDGPGGGRATEHGLPEGGGHDGVPLSRERRGSLDAPLSVTSPAGMLERAHDVI